jgi:transposase-like protein
VLSLREGRPSIPLTAHRDIAAAKRFFEKAMRENGTPETIGTDKNGANKAAIDEVNSGKALPITVPDRVPQQHRPTGPSSD